jgi:hypothetical protein
MTCIRNMSLKVERYCIVASTSLFYGRKQNITMILSIFSGRFRGCSILTSEFRLYECNIKYSTMQYNMNARLQRLLTFDQNAAVCDW